MANAKKLWEKGQTKQKTTPAVSSGPAASAVDNIVKNTQSAAAGQQRVSQSAVDQMLADVQKSRYATVSEVIRAGQKPVTAQPAQQSKITAGRESTTPLQKQTGSASIKDRLARMAQVSRIGKDSTANKPLPTMTAGGALAGITAKVRPAASDTVRKLNSLAADIRSNETDLINMNRRLSVLKAKANKGDASAVDSYNQLADRYNQKFDAYVANIGIYNTLYQGEYRDSAVRQNYAQREYQEFRRQNRDAGVRQAYQQRRLEEELSAPRQIDIGKEGTRTIEHTPTRAEQAVGGALSYYGSGFAQAGGLIAKDLFREDGGQGHSATENVFNVGKSTEVAAAARAWDKVKAGGRDWADGLMKAGHELDERGEIQVKLAKQGLGTVGQALVDLGVVAIQMAGDIGLAVATGGSMLVPMGLRSYGNGYLTAEQMGYSGGEAELYGLGVAAVEVLSEKMFSVFSIAERYAKGVVKQEMSERVINAVVTRMAKSTTGRTALNRLMTLLFSAGSEGLEEVMAGIMEPVIRKATLDHSINVKQEIDWENALYEGLIGGILGGLGGSVDLRNTRATYWKYYKQGINENIERFEEAARKYGIESKEAQQAAKAVWDGGTRKMNEVAGTIDGRPVTYHQLAAMEEARAYGRTDAEGNALQGPTLANSLNPEGLGRYLENDEKVRRQEAARREEAARLDAEEKARVDAGKTAQSAPAAGTSSQGGEVEPTAETPQGETVRLDTARSAQTRAQAPQGVADLSGIPESELTQEEKDELAYGSGAVEDMGRYTGLAQRMGAPARAVADNENAADEGGGEASFSIVRTRTMPWRQQVKGYFKKDGSIRSSDSLYLGESEAFIDGVPQAPLYIPTSVITKATRKTKDKSSKKGHELTERDIESLRDGIDNAVAVIANPSRNALVYITGNIDREGNPIIIAFDLNHDLFGENAHRATSIHGRVSIGGLLDNLGSDATVYVRNENRLDQMLSGRGIHTSQLLAQVKSIDGSIPQNTNNSKEENDNGAVYDGSSQRDAGERGWGGSGSLGETAGGSEAGQVPAQRGSDGSPTQTDRGIQQVRKNESHKAKAEKRRQNGAALEKTSGSSEGIDKTNDRASMQILTDDMVEADAELTEIRTRLEDLGFDVRFFLGSIGLRTGGKARGAQQGNTVWICVDDSKWTATQISKHEELHGEARRDPKLIGRLIGRLRAEETDKLNKITRRYQEALLLRSQGAEERALRVLEEMLCDLYAGINEFTQKNAEARSLHDLIKDEIKSQQAEGVRETRGPPDDGEVSFSLVDTKVPTREEMDADYMAAVENGDMETARRMVEEAAKAAGYDLHLYHGSRKGGGFTVFRDWQYFTGSRKYAERYQERDNPGSLYEVFARSDRMFDTRNAEAAELFEQHRGEYGMGELQENGLPDWTDGYDISEMIEENELDYDGVILDEGGDLVDGEPVSRGPSYVLRKSNQIKSAEPVTYDDDGEIIPLSQRFNQDESDIRFSEIEEGEEDSEEMTAEKLQALAVKAKAAERHAQKVMRQMNLTDKEQGLVNSLLKGALTLDEMRSTRYESAVDKQAVQAVYQARQAYRDAQAPIEEYNKQHRESLNEEARSLTENSFDWKSPGKEILLDRETPRRVFYGITKDAEEADALIHTYVDPIREHEAQKNRMIKRYHERIEKLKIDKKKRSGNKVSEAYAVQYVGELEFIRDWLEQLPEGETRGGLTYAEAKTLLAEFWEQNPNLDQEHIHEAVEEFRAIYDELFSMINEARVRNGYRPIDYRKGYFPHFTSKSADTIVQALSNGLGFGVEVTELPTDITGLTYLFKPGIQWSGHMLQRTGNETDYNVLEGWDRYIPAVANIIYHTDDIQRWRALERTLRYKHGTTGVREKLAAIRDNKDMTEEERDEEYSKLLDESGKADVTHLGAFVQWIGEYTNYLAGKRYLWDRLVEAKLNRKFYSRVQWLENRVAANMLAGNISSAMTNFIPLFQAMGNVRSSSMLRAIGEYALGQVHNRKQAAAWRNGSNFLVNRKGYDPLYNNAFGKVKNALFVPFNIVDDFTSEVIVRARYYDELKNGASPAEAMALADIFAGEVMADRTVGELPVVFNSKTLKVLTMFQVEVNNDLSHFFKDIPRDAKRKGSAAWLALLRSMIRYCIAVFLYNDLFEAIWGRRVAFDPLSMVEDVAGDLTGKQLPNGFELIAEWMRTKEAPDWDKVFDSNKGEKPISELFADIKAWGENVPFLSGMMGGGRYPVFAFLPNFGELGSGVETIWDLAVTHENAPEYDWQQLYKRNRNLLAYMAPPAFGGQIRRTVEGILAARKEGSYTVNKEGERKLQYPILTTYDKWKAYVFGKSSTKGGREWTESGFDTLSTTETQAYLDLVAGGSDPQFIYDIIQDLGGDGRTGVEKAYALAASNLKNEERIRLLDAFVSESQSEKFAAMMTDGGLTFRQCAEVYEQYKALEKIESLKPMEQAIQFETWLDREGYTDDQKAAITEQYKYYNQSAAEPKNYKYLVNAGLTIEKATELATDYAELEKLPGESQVTTNQKMGAVAAAGYLSESDKQTAMRLLHDSKKNSDGISQQDKYKQYITDYQIPVEVYYQYCTLSNGIKGDDKDGDGNTDQYSKCDKLFAIINRLPLQAGQKTSLAIFKCGVSEKTVYSRAPWL